ncbi:MaoC/PaaZ C-terminal domain-containing protein [Pseudomonas sp. LS44]|uniref:MaoC family dehydratase n=1 Tax=Pseudomonas sp. LS44 TaxID=1357074 RepID=UPI00215ACB8B|nr:MaoC/PaaZ C-terminal domain-containing protein [Pseudomonas sp. LS44]UVE17197.1 MaoC/PaaZ C-terminal domain-containing protein [Pseudomonas sp. LS44]
MTIDWHDLPAPPALPALFARALLRRSVTGKQLPDFGLRCPVSVDPAHLQAYRQLCNAADNGQLPPAYPHLLAFPLQMQLLTDKTFPFPLLGLVHLHNRVHVLRPLGGLGPFQISVQLENLQPHAKGALFSLITRLDDQLGLLWEGESRFLCRSVQLDGAPSEPGELAPLEVLPLADWAAPANIGRRYARVAGDYNPIHLTALSARLFGFPRAIAHGLWNKGRALAALADRLPAAGYEVEVQFRKPVLLPSHVRLLASAPAEQGQFQLQGKDDLLHMSGSWRLKS